VKGEASEETPRTEHLHTERTTPADLAHEAGARLRRVDSAPLPWVFRRTAREVANAHGLTYSDALKLVIQGFEEAPR
jgi:hypothetical protein